MSDANYNNSPTERPTGSDQIVDGQHDAAFAGAQLVADWDELEGGWPSLLRAPGARLAAAGYRLAANAFSTNGDEPQPLAPADLEMTADGQFRSERLIALQDALVESELSPATDLRETITLALDVAFEHGVKRAIADEQHERSS